MATVLIPARQDRTIPPMPTRKERDGHSRVRGMVTRTLESLPADEAVVDLDSAPSTSKVYEGIEHFERVISVPGVDSFQCPPSLLTLDWVVREQCEGIDAVAFNEDGVARACSQPHVFIQQMIKEQLETDDVEDAMDHATDFQYEVWERMTEGEAKPLLRLLAALGLEVNQNQRHKTDISLVNAGLCYAFLEYKTSLSAGHPVWDEILFASSTVVYQVIRSLSPTALKMLSQIVFYSNGIVERKKLRARRVLVALTAPPTRLHYLLIDFDTKTIIISPNVIVLPVGQVLHPDRRAHLILQLVNPEAMTVYWRQALWFHLVAIYFNYPSLITDACMADALRPEKERRIPADILGKLRDVFRLLGEVPPPGYWVGFCLQKSKLTCSLVDAFHGFIQTLWMKFTWGLLGTRMTLHRAHRVQLLREETLEIERVGSHRRWWIAALRNGVRWENEDGDKQFVLYGHEKILIKMYDPSSAHELEAEMEIYRHFASLQGFGIPRLYGSGRVRDSDQRFLILSYEGQRLRLWDDHNRESVKKIVALFHDAGFHHHDLEPRNVVVDERGKVTLIDFGLSQNPCAVTGCVEEEEWKGCA